MKIDWSHEECASGRITSSAPQLSGEYNGVNIEIANDGSCSLTFKGATNSQGVPTNSSQGNTVFQIKTDAGGKPVSLGVSSFGFDLDILDRVDRATPSEAEIQAMTGHYVSDEAETEFNVTLTPKGLEIHQRPDVVYSLKPTYAGGFESELGSVRFLRDASGQITGLSLGDSRMWDLRFRRVEAK